MYLIFNILSVVYGWLVRCRLYLYKHQLLKSYKFNIPIISIGNITVGGTGKTPMTLWVFNQLILKNKKPCIITRGYNRSSKELMVVNKDYSNYTSRDIGDEPLMMLKNNQNIQMVVANDKIKAIRFAIDNLDVDSIILDDGFQSLYIDRDFDIVMINAKQNNNKYHLLPRGCAREPIQNIKRANAIVINRGDQPSINNIFINNHLNIFKAENVFGLVDGSGRAVKNFVAFRVLALCGIGDPDSFFKTLNNYRINLNKKLIFRDHYNYTATDMGRIYRCMNNSNCNTIITTWKDYYKIHPLNINNQKIIILNMELEIKDRALLRMIDGVVNEN